jgi:CheY-like chemotaxis protein
VRILVVDDLDIDRAIITKMIQAAGHEVIAASSGEAAIAANAVMDFDLIVMDQRMPEMDGIETTRRIRAMDGARGRVPIVALSGLQLSDEFYRNAGVDRFLSKDGVSVERIIKAMADGVAAGRERDSPYEGAPVIAESSDSFRIPRAIAFSIMVGIPAMIGTGAWYMSSQANDARHLAEAQATDARHLAEALVAARAEVTAQQAAQAALIRQTGEGLSKLDHDQTDMINRLDVRLTRLEAQISFFVGVNAPPAAKR